MGDVGSDTVTGVAIDLTATDATGSTTLNATLVISKDPGPVVAIPLSTQIPTSSTFSAPSTLLYHPSTPFKLTLDPNTFQNRGSSSGLGYYAVTSNNTPLPSWVLFDVSTLTFSGQTPDYQSLIEPPQTFGIQVIASDVQGFAGTSLFFDIEVGVHLLAFSDAHLMLNATTGGEVKYDLLGSIKLDGSSASRDSVASVSAATPSWLTIDNTTLTLSGTVPKHATSTNFTLQVLDIYGDQANSIVVINIPTISTAIFKTPLTGLNATAGKTFSYDLSTFLNNRSDIIMSAQFSPVVTWMSFDAKSFVMTGEAPPSTKASLVVISLVATSQSTHISESESFDLSISPGGIIVTATSSSSARKTSTSSISTETGNYAPFQAMRSQHDSKTLLLAVLIPVGLVSTAILLALLCCWQRRRAAKNKNYTVHQSKHEISAPLEATSSILEMMTEKPIRINAPVPLKLDTTGFGDARASTILPIKPPTIRRSQTISGASDARKSRLISQSDVNGNRGRAYSENTLSKTDKDSRMTQDSAYLTIPSRENSTGTKLTRNYSNYSRKGRARRSVMLPAVDVAGPSQQTQDTAFTRQNTILNLKDSNFSFTPLDKFSIISKTAPAQQSSLRNLGKSETSMSLTKKHSRFKPVLVGYVPSTIGIGHGGRNSIISMSSPGTSMSRKRRSIGHGNGIDWSSHYDLSRTSVNWVTVGVSGVNPLNRRSIPRHSISSQYSDSKIPRATSRMSALKQVTQSPDVATSAMACRSVSSANSNPRHSRPVSRAINASPFFAGSSFRVSRSGRRSPKKFPPRASYADSPTVPEGATSFGRLPGNTHKPYLQELSEEATPQRDSFGITYGLAQEGTRQLRSYIKSQMSRARSKRSMRSHKSSRSIESRDSRFESAASLHQAQAVQRRRPRSEMDFDDYVIEHSESSWETQNELDADCGEEEEAEEENVITYYADRSVDEELPPPRAAFMSSGTELSRHTSQSMPNSPIMGKEMGMLREESGFGADEKARVRSGAGRRPESVDARALEPVGRSLRGELDYTAFI